MLAALLYRVRATTDILDVQAQVSAKQKETADNEARCQQLQLDVERDEREQDRVKMRIAAQPMQLKEVQAMRQDVRMVIKVRQNKAALAEDAEQQSEAAREEYVEAVSELERNLLNVNGLLARAKLHPACAEAANGVDYEVKLTSQMDTDVTLSVGMPVLPRSYTCKPPPIACMFCAHEHSLNPAAGCGAAGN